MHTILCCCDLLDSRHSSRCTHLFIYIYLYIYIFQWFPISWVTIHDDQSGNIEYEPLAMSED